MKASCLLVLLASDSGSFATGILSDSEKLSSLRLSALSFLASSFRSRFFLAFLVSFSGEDSAFFSLVSDNLTRLFGILQLALAAASDFAISFIRTGSRVNFLPVTGLCCEVEIATGLTGLSCVFSSFNWRVALTVISMKSWKQSFTSCRWSTISNSSRTKIFLARMCLCELELVRRAQSQLQRASTALTGVVKGIGSIKL